MSRNVLIQIIRGPLVNMPVLGDGEFFFSTDHCQLYVGFGGNALPIGAPMGIIIQDSITPAQQAGVDVRRNLQVVATLGNTVGKTVVMKTGSLTTTAVTANQTILTYTVTAGKVLYIEYIDIQARLTAPSATASVLGTSIIQMSGVTVYTGNFVNPTTSDAGSQTIRLQFSEPIPLAAAQALGFLTTPAAATSMLWTANFVGYEV